MFASKLAPTGAFLLFCQLSKVSLAPLPETLNVIRMPQKIKAGALVIDHKKLAVIHIVKKELGLSDDEYRDTLEKITGIRSAKDLDEQSFRKLMNYFARSKYYRINQDGLTFRQKMYIKNLKEQIGWHELHFTNFLKKYYKKKTIDSLSKKEAGNVVESLKNILKHKRMKK